MVRIEIVLADNNIRRFANTVDLLPQRFRTEARRGLSDAGKKTTTEVRRALRDQMNVKRYGAIVRATEGFVQADGLGFEIRAIGKGLKIEEFKTKVTKRGVFSDPWNVGRTFQRSFKTRVKGRLMARTTDKRRPIRTLFGPSPIKELVKDQSLSTFEASIPRFAQAVLKRLAKLMP